METFIDIISEITFYLSLLCPLLYFKAFVSNNRAFRLFTIYIFVIAIIQILTKLVIKVYEMESNLFLSHYYFILQFIFLSLFYFQLLRYKWIYAMLGVVLVFLTYQYVKDPSLYFRYNAGGMFFTQLIIVVYALIYMFQSLSVKRQFSLINAGIFIYLLSSSLIFACGNLVFNIGVPEYFSSVLIDINQFLYLAFLVILLIAWYHNYRRSSLIHN
jgi:hypothetical protein